MTDPLKEHPKNAPGEVVESDSGVQDGDGVILRWVAKSENLQGGNSVEKRVRDLPPRARTFGGWESWWWDKTNPKCLACSLACKQSDKVTLVYCPQFDKGEE